MEDEVAPSVPKDGFGRAVAFARNLLLNTMLDESAPLAVRVQAAAAVSQWAESERIARAIGRTGPGTFDFQSQTVRSRFPDLEGVNLSGFNPVAAGKVPDGGERGGD